MNNLQVRLIAVLILAVTSEAGRFTGDHARKHSVPKGADDCRRVTCQPGSTCTINEAGLPECTCVHSCPVNRVKPTCGSDDKWYVSHCHLHQTACLTETRISVEHGNECFSRGITCAGIDKLTFKSRVLEHYRTQFKHPEHTYVTTTSEVSKNLLLGLIFNHYDMDQDDIISTDEVLISMTKDGLLSISTHCTMTDILAEHEANGDERWSNEEFFEAFGVGGYYLEEGLQTKETITTAGERLILGCDIHGDTIQSDIVWTRNGVALETLSFMDGIQIFGDGHLYFTPLTTMHAGNYTCSIRGRVLPKQTHTVRVKVEPTVRVCPENQLMATGMNAKFYCNAWGVPQPKITWQRNGLRLRENEIAGLNNRTLTIEDAKIENTGRFICSATNELGTKDVDAVLVEEEAILSRDPLRSLFYVFHKNGIMAIDPDTCTVHSDKKSTDMIPNTNEKLCNVFNKTKQPGCLWGGAVNVRNRFIYVTQPKENRILVLSIGNEQIVEYIKMKSGPVSLEYVGHLDQVWVVNWGKSDQSGVRIIQVIPEASEFHAHHPIHMEPSNHHYDSVRSLYIPPEQIPGQGFFEYGFAHHDKELGLDKIDLKSMKKVSTLELVSHGCVPRSLAYVAFGGYIVVNCGNSITGKQMIIDYITGAVVSVNENIKGVPKISPNGEFLVSIDYNQGAIFVQTISELGKIEQHFEIRANIVIGDVAFFPSVTRDSYDMLLSPREDNEALFVDLDTGSLKVIQLNGKPINPENWPQNEHNRQVVSDGLLDGYLATPLQDSLYILDTKTQKMHCDIGLIKNGNVIQPVSYC